MKFAPLILATLSLAACNQDRSVPTESENRQLDDASNLLDQAPDELDRVDERLPAANQAANRARGG